MNDRTTLDISWKAIAKILIAAVLVWVWLQIWSFFTIILVAIFIAVGLHPTVQRMERRGVPRWLGAVGVVFLIAAALTGLIAAGWVSLAQQSEFIVRRLEEFNKEIRASFPLLQHVLPSTGESNTGLGRMSLTLLQSVTNAFGMIVVALVLTIYLLIEWKQTLEWCVAFVPQAHRAKVRRTLAEAQVTVYGYVAGNVLTSIITAVATFAVLASLKVPAALVLALIAGVFDFVPVVGFIVSAALAAMLAATVSVTAVVVVLGFYLVFNAIENYYIVPKVYGRTLELSNLAVLIAVIVGAYLGGVIGALLALPIAATYPAIERVWLRDYLGDETVDQHERLAG